MAQGVLGWGGSSFRTQKRTLGLGTEFYAQGSVSGVRKGKRFFLIDCATGRMLDKYPELSTPRLGGGVVRQRPVVHAVLGRIQGGADGAARPSFNISIKTHSMLGVFFYHVGNNHGNKAPRLVGWFLEQSGSLLSMGPRGKRPPGAREKSETKNRGQKNHKKEKRNTVMPNAHPRNCPGAPEHYYSPNSGQRRGERKKGKTRHLTSRKNSCTCCRRREELFQGAVPVRAKDELFSFMPRALDLREAAAIGAPVFQSRR